MGTSTRRSCSSGQLLTDRSCSLLSYTERIINIHPAWEYIAIHDMRQS
jgi:hypothetical protein